jgi:hypothetical protein
MRHVALLVALTLGCGGDEADEIGIGAQCGPGAECPTGQMCLAFKGGYCGLSGCAHDTDCPGSSGCVAHTDGMNYCFRTCTVKEDCNANRDVENESNCSSSATFVDAPTNRKACIPPSGI